MNGGAIDPFYSRAKSPCSTGHSGGLCNCKRSAELLSTILADHPDQQYPAGAVAHGAHVDVHVSMCYGTGDFKPSMASLDPLISAPSSP